LDVEALLEDIQQQIENEKNTDGVQTNSVKTLEEYKGIVDLIIQKLKVDNTSEEQLQSHITNITSAKDIISTSTSTKKELYVGILDYLVVGLQELLNIEASQFKSLLLLNDSETQELQNIIAFNIE
jgi:hypothetical protein